MARTSLWIGLDVGGIDVQVRGAQFRGAVDRSPGWVAPFGMLSLTLGVERLLLAIDEKTSRAQKRDLRIVQPFRERRPDLAVFAGKSAAAFVVRPKAPGQELVAVDDHVRARR